MNRKLTAAEYIELYGKKWFSVRNIELNEVEIAAILVLIGVESPKDLKPHIFEDYRGKPYVPRTIEQSLYDKLKGFKNEKTNR